MTYAKILDLNLLKEREKLVEIDKWLTLLDWDNGWHYDLDLVWLLEEIEKSNLPKGATILDAGAGLGVMQFILAGRGYNVISLDFAPRKIPQQVQELFNIKTIENEVEDKNPYREFIKYDSEKKVKTEVPFFDHLAFYAYKKTKKVESFIKRSLFKLSDGKAKGNITFLKGSFNEIPLEDNSVDFIVSVSAIEHNKKEKNAEALSEFKRVVKNGGKVCITTSFTDKPESFFHEESLGWCFSNNDMKNIFNVSVEGDYKTVENQLKTDSLFKSRIPKAYFVSSRNGLPFGKIENLKYLPIGIMYDK